LTLKDLSKLNLKVGRGELVCWGGNRYRTEGDRGGRQTIIVRRKGIDGKVELVQMDLIHSSWGEKREEGFSS